MKTTILRECVRRAKEKNDPSHPQWNNYIHYSFIVQDNKILEFGLNRKGPALVRFGYLPFQKIHSETDAYKKARGIMDHSKGFEIVNIRLNKKSEMRLSKPCNCCYNFLTIAGCKTVWYSTDDQLFKNINI